jgi:hypothetical protein
MKNNNETFKPFLLRLITRITPTEAPILDASKKYVFILSTGRTGTKYIADYLSEYKDVYAVHEPKPSKRLRLWSMARLERNINDDYLYKVFLKFRKKKINTVNEKIYIESNPFLSGFATSIAMNMPNAYIIHIVRDPRDRVTSSINNGELRIKKRLMISLVPYWHLRPLRLFGQTSSSIEKITKLWPLMNNHIAKASEHTNNYICIKFEDLFNNEDKMKELVDFIGINEKYIKEELTGAYKTNKNASKYNDLTSWKQWSSSFAKKIDEIVGNTMEDYGYGKEKEWKAKVDR